TTAAPNTYNFSVTRPNIAAGNTDATQVLITGTQATTWYQQDQNGIWPPSGVQIRIPYQTGQWLNLARVQNSPPYWGTMNGTTLQLTLQVPYQGGQPYPPNVDAIPITDANASCDIQLGNDLLPFHQPIQLSSGIVIDLKFCSTNVQTLAGIGGTTTPYVDIMFSPRGGVSGYLSALGPLHFLLRDLKSATAGVDPRNLAAVQTANAELMVLTVFPQTGLVQVFEVDPADLADNTSGTAGADGLADDLFAFAKQGKSAGR